MPKSVAGQDVYFINVRWGRVDADDCGEDSCPTCGGRKFFRLSRVRGPLPESECEGLSVVQPRISNRDSWWNRGPIAWLVRPPDYSSPHGWYVVHFLRECKCGYHFTAKGKGNEDGEVCRKFGRIRLLLFRFREKLAEWLEKVIPEF